MTASAQPEFALGLLGRIATFVRRTPVLDEVLGPVLRALSEELGLQRATLALMDRASGALRIEAAHGLTPSEVTRGSWTLGEGVTGRVAISGEPFRVANIAVDERFTDKTGMRAFGSELCFVCVPVLDEDRVLATLSAFGPPNDDASLERFERVLSLTAALLAPAVRQRVAVRAESVSHDDAPGNILGRSKAMRQVYSHMGQVAGSQTTVLLLGESGTGKELVASALHGDSGRARHPFIKVNCAALPEGVIESELFGHERGAFTGAHQRRRGRFEQAEGGTLFLDEIGDLSPATQVKLLRVLQEREFERVGGNHTVRVDVRVIAATSRDLERMVADGGFRADLYYRLNVFPIRLPALRERGSDILLLADHFVEVFNKSHGKAVRRIATAAIDMMVAYHWPGNVRELENCVERAVLLARDDVVLGHHLPPTLQTAEHSGTGPRSTLKAAVAAVEEDLIRDALKSHRGNMAAAARQLGVTERMMGTRVVKYSIDVRRYKAGR
ncbi:MAG: sigma 54-interacting transcriptional regulator [Proteobacteria bacterium]|nr:sigma 54-interacting transcriptional regulator [Pseudomonadota bacterium]